VETPLIFPKEPSKIVTVTSKGHITLPVAVRKRLGLEPGTKVNVVVRDDGRIELTPVKKSITCLKGIVAKPDRPVTLEDMEAAIVDGATSALD
jgi:AbrB family looped-hinge helix DNA binding protein